jgi:cell division protease FtsH
LVAGVALFLNIYRPDEVPDQITLTQLAEAIRDKQVESISVNGPEVQVIMDENQPPSITRREENIPLTETLVGLGVTAEELALVKIIYEAPGNGNNWLALFINLLPLIFIAGLFFILFRQSQGSNNQALSFGKSRARLFTGDKPTVTFADVAGSDEAYQELQDIVEFLKEPQKFAAL